MPAILTHKKFQAGIASSLVILFGQLFPAWGETQDLVLALASIDWLVVSAPITAAILGQGLADFGKESAKVDCEAVLSTMEEETDGAD